MWKATLSAPAPALPEGCIAHVIAFTTLRNACRMPAVLSVFLLASESGVVWERFLPSDYPNILARSLESSSQLDFSSPLLIYEGKKVRLWYPCTKVHGILEWGDLNYFSGRGQAEHVQTPASCGTIAQ